MTLSVLFSCNNKQMKISSALGVRIGDPTFVGGGRGDGQTDTHITSKKKKMSKVNPILILVAKALLLVNTLLFL